MSWLPDQGPGATPFERVFALCPDLHAAWRDFSELFWERALVPPVLLELCRLRIAGMHGARALLAERRREAPAAGLDEAQVEALDHWWRSDRFSPEERACLAFAEQFALDASAVDDALAAGARDVLGDAGLVAFVEALALFDGFARFAVVLDVEAPEARP